MPIVDGLTSTKMIRSYEKTHKGILSERAINIGRVPIIAVSASLVEKDREKYIETGFDGWILKPIDFKRLGVLMSGIVDNEARDSCLYKPGSWEHGGWFARSDRTPPHLRPGLIQESRPLRCRHLHRMAIQQQRPKTE